MDYKARFYSVYLNRFVQPDTIVPNMFYSQSLNRYAYVNNSPVNYIDPSGHMPVAGCGNDSGSHDCYEDDPVKAADNAAKLAELEYDPTGQKQKRNREIAEAILYDGTELVASIFYDPADWAYTAYHCANGDCSPWMVAAGFMPLIPSSAGRHLDDAPWKTIVDKEYWDIVERAFKGDPKVIELTDNLKVFRRYGGASLATGSPWFSPQPYVRGGNARRYLALPNTNLASDVAEFIIPKGNKILVGTAASKSFDDLFGSKAVGGGLQIYLPDPSIARRIK